MNFVVSSIRFLLTLFPYFLIFQRTLKWTKRLHDFKTLRLYLFLINNVYFFFNLNWTVVQSFLFVTPVCFGVAKVSKFFFLTSVCEKYFKLFFESQLVNPCSFAGCKVNQLFFTCKTFQKKIFFFFCFVSNLCAARLRGAKVINFSLRASVSKTFFYSLNLCFIFQSPGF